MMETAVLSLIWLFLYGYCIEGTGAIQKGRGRRIVAGLISLLILALSFWIPLWTVWLLEGVTAVLFVLFFDEEPFRQQWKRAAAPALLFSCLTAAEAEVYARFDEMTEGKTSIYISHRMSSCRFCDDIIVFDDGRIEERGSHETLLAAGGLYSQLWNAQAKYYA